MNNQNMMSVAIQRLEARMTVIEGQLAAMQEHIGGLDWQKVEATMADLAEVAASVERLQPASAWTQEEIVDAIREAVLNGHHGANCVDLEAWKFCTGLAYTVKQAEQSGWTRDQIRLVYLDAVSDQNLARTIETGLAKAIESGNISGNGFSASRQSPMNTGEKGCRPGDS